MSDVALVVFARAPISGKVKTRLAASVGDDEAMRVYASLLRLALARAAQWTGPRAIACADAASLDYFSALPQAAGFLCFSQQGADLGMRMRTALQRALGWASAAVLIGTDVADHAAADLPAAQEALAVSDVVLGPVADGGYWLIGVRRDHPRVFEGLPWGTPRVFAQTLQRCLGLSVRVLPMRNDVDDAAALAACGVPAAPGLPHA